MDGDNKRIQVAEARMSINLISYSNIHKDPAESNPLVKIKPLKKEKPNSQKFRIGEEPSNRNRNRNRNRSKRMEKRPAEFV